ncbi:signal recognition particle 19 kDa protein [Lingula anatina]|uniref:Signal recognition particle 19 kDa protein n=1 Tax=Lingula anatina TaxID=7574 RepID=A0A1S3HPI4_LINAN|nr:signal recognition particle 19 kDa protein [Lingula anatina]|eukprot:XP_013387946.1 signal recognition particle 19 kDa protein [Lingula anatina]
MARPWNPDFQHTDRERWICVYPAYINSRKSVLEGRKIPKDKAVDNPTYSEIRDICASAGMTVGVENKVYPRERDPRDMRFRGRIRIQLKKEDGTPMLDKFPTRKSVFLYLGEMIPKLKGRAQSHGNKEQQTSQQQGNTGAQKGKKGKGKGKR